MLNRNIILVGFIVSVICLVLASLLYPGGSPRDIHSVGYAWTENYISDMLEYKAVNGSDNASRPLAVTGVLLMGLVTGLAFMRFARKVGIKKYSTVIYGGGIILMLFAALLTIPSVHFLMVNLSIVVNLLVFFYVTVILFKSDLTVLKWLAVLFLASFYGATYMFTSRTGLDYMPLVQKITHIFQIAWLLGLEYFTRPEDFKRLT